MAVAFPDAIYTAPVFNPVFVNGYYRSDCRLLNLSIPSGASQAGRALIVFDDAVYGRRTLVPGATVTIYLDYYRRGATFPFFDGTILAVNPDYSPGMGEVYEAADGRWDLNAVSVRRNYNAIDRISDLPRERLTWRQIARKVIADFNTSNPSSLTVIIDESGLSEAEAPPQDCEGMAVGAYLDGILDEGSRLENSRWRVGYNRSTDEIGDLILEVFSEGYGRRRVVRYGVAPAVSARAQAINAGDIRTQETEDGMVNRIVAIGGEDIVQHAFPLTEWWPSSIEGVSEDTIILNPDRYGRQWTEIDSAIESRFENPEFIDGASSVGRRYRIPPIELYDETTDLQPGDTDSTSLIFPEILDRLADPGQRAFIVYQSSAYPDGRYLVKTSGFSIENREVVFSEPFIINYTDVSYLVDESITGLSDDGEDGDNRAYSFDKDSVSSGDLVGGEIVVTKTVSRFNESRSYNVSKIKISEYRREELTNLKFDLVAKEGDTINELVNQKALFWEPKPEAPNEGKRVTYTGDVQSVSDNGDGTFECVVSLYEGFTDEQFTSWQSDISSGGEVPAKLLNISIYGISSDRITAGRIVSNADSVGGRTSVSLASPLKDGDVIIPVDDASYAFTLRANQTSETNWFKPTAVWLVACYRDTVRLAYDTGKQGDGEREIVERVERREFHREYMGAGSFTLGENGQVSGRTNEKTLVRDDTDRLGQWAEARLKHRVRRGVTHRVALPEFPTNFQVGDVARSPDRQIDGRSILAVEYTGATNNANESGVETVLTIGG